MPWIDILSTDDIFAVVSVVADWLHWVNICNLIQPIMEATFEQLAASILVF